MDYQGNYFPEEQDENESKIYRTVKNIFKWTMYGISFVIYAFIIYMMIVNRDSKILKRNYMLDETINTDQVLLYRINTRVFMNDDGSMQTYNVDYSPEHKLIEIGLKYNARKLTDNERGDCLTYVLSDKNGNTYELVNTITDSSGRYGFSRLTFKSIEIDLDSNDLRYNQFLKASVRPAIQTSKDEFVRSEDEIYLSVYRKSDNELLHKFTIYDNSVTFNKTDYNE